jgi:hypothetical protein
MFRSFLSRRFLHRAHDGAIVIHVLIVIGDLSMKALHLVA